MNSKWTPKRFYQYMAIILVVSFFVPVASISHAEIIDGILATVNDEIILQSDLMHELAPVFEELRMTASSQQEFSRLVEENTMLVLDQAINQKLLIREAMLLGIEVKDRIIEGRIDELKAQFASYEEFIEELNKAGETMSDFREKVRKDVLAQNMARYKRQQFENDIVVSESEVAQYYEDHKREAMRPERIRARQIFLVSDPGTKERKRTILLLAEIKKELAAGAKFSDLAKAHSQAPGAENGGIIGWVQKGDLIGELDTALFNLEEGGISFLVETAGGVHLLQAVKKESAGLATLDDLRIEIEPHLRRTAVSERYEKWLTELRKRSRVRVFI